MHMAVDARLHTYIIVLQSNYENAVRDLPAICTQTLSVISRQPLTRNAHRFSRLCVLVTGEYHNLRHTHFFRLLIFTYQVPIPSC